MHDYSPNCIMMLPAYARRVTTDESEIKKKDTNAHCTGSPSIQKHISVY